MNKVLRWAMACSLAWLSLFGPALLPSVVAQTLPTVAEQSSKKCVLILYSYGYGSKGVEIFSDGFRSTLAEAGFSISDLFFEYLDLERNKADPQYRARLLDLLERKYSTRQMELVITIQQPALNFLLHEGKVIAPQAPVINLQAPLPSESEAGTRRILSPLARFDRKGTLERALALFPATQRVVFVCGTSEADRKMAIESAAIAEPWKNKLTFEYTADLPLQAMLTKVAKLPPNTLIMFTQYKRDIQGRVTIAYEVEHMIVKVANAPVFGLYDFNLVNGGVGGSVVSVQGLGERTARLALDLLDGKLQLSQPITRATHEVVPMFDWSQIKRWGGDPNALGTDTIFLNRVQTFMEQYRLYVNCLKHGFPDKRQGEIRIELRSAPSSDDAVWQVCMRVSDDGIGLPQDFEARRSQSLGLQLVSDLTRQLGGTLEAGPGPGAAWSLTFNIRENT